MKLFNSTKKSAAYFDDWDGFFYDYENYANNFYEELTSAPTDAVDYCEINGKFYVEA